MQKKVDALFISHLDKDHVNGLDRLLSLISVDTVFIPYSNDIVSVIDLVGADLENQLSTTLVESEYNPGIVVPEKGSIACSKGYLNGKKNL